jgi:hypothetical protein
LLQRADPRVSIIVPTFNRSPFLAECLESLFAQTLPPAQVIVVNDRSTDATRAVVEPFLSRILYLETTAQVGKPGAANLGLEHVTGDYVWVFDDDDVALPDALARFTAALERHPHCGFSWSPWFYADTRPDGRLGPVGWETTEPPIDELGFVPALLERNFLGGAALFARRRCYDEVGNNHPALTRSQDYDIAIRFARRYPAVRVEGGATFIYRQHEGARGNTADRFAAPARFAKWLQYDQRIFRELQKDMPLAEYLPPGHDLASSSRLALIQRFTLMASHLLVDEALEDLALLARRADQGALTRAERRPLRLIAYADPWYGCGSVWDRPEFTARLRQLATTSPLVRAMRAEAIRSFLRGVRSEGLGRLPLVAQRTLRLLTATSLTRRAPDRAG